jgi:ubiquinone biosynthesis protein COQ9
VALPRRLLSSNSAVRTRLLQASLRQVPLHGWTDDAISMAVEKEQLPLSMVGMVTPTQLVEWFMEDRNQEFAKQLDGMDMEGMELPERLSLAIQTRLEHVVAVLPNWHEGMALGATGNTTTTAQQLEEIVVLIANKVVDGTSHPPLSQLQRTAIGAVYVATELHLLSDDSVNQEASWQFLRDRMQELHLLASQQSSPFSGDSIVAASAVATSLAGAVVSLAQPAAMGVASSLLPQIIAMISPPTAPVGTSAMDYSDLPPFPEEPKKS